MSEERQEKTNGAAQAERLTAIDLADYVIKTTSAVLPVLRECGGEKAETAARALEELQRLAIRYVTNAARRAQRFSARRSWRNAKGRWRRNG